MQQNPSCDHLSTLHFLVPPNPFPGFSDHMLNNVPLTDSFHLLNHRSPHDHDHDHDHGLQYMMNEGYNPNASQISPAEEAEEMSVISERKQRRMISNRESARRSRMRKQKHLDELWSQVVWLRSENHQLIDKLNRAAERHDTVVQENAQLKEEATELRRMLADLQIDSPTTSFATFRDQFDHNDVMPCNTAYLRAESSNQSNITTSMDLLG